MEIFQPSEDYEMESESESAMETTMRACALMEGTFSACL
jgi:hypothetical protein